MNVSHRSIYITIFVCPSCGSQSFPDKIENGKKICSKCGYYNKIQPLAQP